MAGKLKHRFQSGKSDGGDPSLLNPSNWNDSLVISEGSDGQVLQRDSTQADGWSFTSVVIPRPPVRWLVQGNAQAGTTKVAQALIEQAVTISKVWLWSDVAPTGTALIIDILKNGTTIWTTQANRAQIAVGANSGSQTVFDVTTLVAGDRLSLQIAQVGSSTPGGNDLLVTVQFA